MKKLTRIKLINWYSFYNETISFGDTTQITGQNSAGKSTILDAMQLVLTQDQKHFNPAGNDANKRDIKGYVRYRTGKEDAVFQRKGYVISYVALEFMEESTGRHFVTGVKMDSPSETDHVKKKWFAENCKLEDLSFIVDGKPAKDKEFKVNGTPVSFINQDKEADKKFRSLYGRLERRFADLIPKALGLKTIGNITNFVNDFLLPYGDNEKIDTEELSRNLTIIRDLQDELEDMEKRKAQLSAIHEFYEKYASLVGEKEANSILFQLLKKKEIEEEKEREEKREKETEKRIENLKMEEDVAGKLLDTMQAQLNGLIVSRDTNSSSRMIQTLEEKIKNEKIEERRLIEDELKLIRNVGAIDSFISSPFFPNDISADTKVLLSAEIEYEKKAEEFSKIESIINSLEKDYNKKEIELGNEMQEIKKKISFLSSLISELKANVRKYPVPGVEILKGKIEKEFKERHIDSDVYVFADRLEVVEGMEEWQNAVEGYLGARRFNLIVEPKYFDIALDVYDRYKNEIHGVSLVNTKKLRIDKEINKSSLAAVVSSKNQYVLSYANFLLGDVIRCENVHELENHNKAITSSCMLYSQLAVSKIAPDKYKTPYIGKDALERQIELKTNELEGLQVDKEKIDKQYLETEKALLLLKDCHTDIVKEYINKPNELKECRLNIEQFEKELESAKSDPSVAEIQEKIENAERKVSEYREKYHEKRSAKDIAERDIEVCRKKIDDLAKAISVEKDALSLIETETPAYYEAAVSRFEKETSEKVESAEVLKKLESQKATLEKNINKTRDSLVENQLKYRGGEYGSGPEVMSAFEKEWKLLSDNCIEDKKDTIKQYEEKNIVQFKESFLAKMQENIKKAKGIFANINKRMEGIYYGNDSYCFKVEGNKEKLGLYKMIMSDMNAEGPTLFSTVLEEDYRAEMEELFDKIRVSSDADMKVVHEYADYRNYLQYDIVIKNKEGETKLLSKNTGYTSGGETQTPCYVAIAASFNQAYDTGAESIGIIILDEAFNKMDNDRVSSLMEFLTNQGFQMIIATPPDKTSIIGDYVDKINIVTKDKDGGISAVVEAERED